MVPNTIESSEHDPPCYRETDRNPPHKRRETNGRLPLRLLQQEQRTVVTKELKQERELTNNSADHRIVSLLFDEIQNRVYAGRGRLIRRRTRGCDEDTVRESVPVSVSSSGMNVQLSAIHLHFGRSSSSSSSSSSLSS